MSKDADILERLSELFHESKRKEVDIKICVTLSDACEEIARLRAEVERLRGEQSTQALTRREQFGTAAMSAMLAAAGWDSPGMPGGAVSTADVWEAKV